MCMLLVAVAGAGAWAWNRSDDTTSTLATSTSVPDQTTSTSVKPLTAPKASVTQDAQFLAEVTQADPALATYEKSGGNTALRSLLTDGSAFCAFLNRDGNIDEAMVGVAVGARQVEPQTHLPLSVTTFNTIEAVALLDLCPSLQKMVPASDLTRIRGLGASLSAPSN
jgi:hypothetical protein